MYETVLKIKRNLEGDLIVSVDDHHAWKVSEDFRFQMISDIKDQLGGEFNALALRLLQRIISI